MNGDTALQYANMAIQVKRLAGDYDAASFSNYCAALDILAGTGYNPEEEKKLTEHTMRISTLTLRYRKAACMHTCLIEGRPWLPHQSWLLDRALDGRAADDAPRIPRQALTMEQLEQLEAFLRREGRFDCADGVVVFYGCCLRGQDIRDMTAEWTVLTPTGPKLTPVCMSRKKVSEREANLHGGVTYNPIRTDRAFDILKKRVASTPEGNLFPKWNSAHVTLAMQKCKKIHGWQGLNYSAHCIRDTAAQHVHDAAIEAAALEAARVAGQWDSLDVTYKYAVESAGLRRPSNMHPKRPEKKISATEETKRRVVAAAATQSRRAVRGKAGAGKKTAAKAAARPAKVSVAVSKKNSPAIARRGGRGRQPAARTASVKKR